MKHILVLILSITALCGCTVKQICTAPVPTYNAAGTKCIEYTKKCVYVGNGKFVRPDNNIYVTEQKDDYKVGKKYLIYFNNMGTDDITDDIIIYIR